MKLSLYALFVSLTDSCCICLFVYCCVESVDLLFYSARIYQRPAFLLHSLTSDTLGCYLSVAMELF
jgi:hypothetical protein